MRVHAQAETCWDQIGFIMSITRRGDLHKARDRYMSEALRGGMLHWGKWTTGTCPGCLCKPEVLTANDSYPYSPHPDWWWQKGRYSSACVTQLLWLLLPKALQLDKEMKPTTPRTNDSRELERQKYTFPLLLLAVHTLCRCPYFPLPFCNSQLFSLWLSFDTFTLPMTFSVRS